MKSGVTEDLIRLSVGLEAIEDLQNALRQSTCRDKQMSSLDRILLLIELEIGYNI